MNSLFPDSIFIPSSNQKLNRRVEFTKNALQEAFLSLVAEKPLQRITVTDVCARADINRSTFYLHYKDIRSLIEEIEDEILKFVEYVISQHKPLDDPIYIEGLHFMKNSPQIRAMLRALLSDQGDPQFLHRLQRMGFVAFSYKWDKRIPPAYEAIKPLLYAFVVTGITAATGIWMEEQESSLSAADLVKLLQQIVDNGISNLIPHESV